MLLPQCARPRFNREHYSSVYFDVYVYGKQRGREILYRMVADSPGFQTSRQRNIFLASRKRPDRLWDLPSLQLNRYRGPFPRAERPAQLHTKTGALLLVKRYILYKVLACSTAFFQLSLFCAISSNCVHSYSLYLPKRRFPNVF